MTALALAGYLLSLLCPLSQNKHKEYPKSDGQGERRMSLTRSDCNTKERKKKRNSWERSCKTWLVMSSRAGIRHAPWILLQYCLVKRVVLVRINYIVIKYFICYWECRILKSWEIISACWMQQLCFNWLGQFYFIFHHLLTIKMAFNLPAKVYNFPHTLRHSPDCVHVSALVLLEEQ